MATTDKDTLYVDIDDEITTIIDKVRSSSGKIVALVLPKRATVFQSIVNMKLLKRAAESAKKHLVLITTEANLMPLAGAVGLHVAATPQSKPEIPAASPAASDDEPTDEAISADEAYTADNAGDQAIGDLAARTGHVVAGASTAPEAVSLEEDAGDSEAKPAKAQKNRHLKVPNFNKFRLRLFLALVGLVALVAGLYVCIVILPRAAIAITTNTSTVNVSINPTLDTAAQTLDTKALVVPAKAEQTQKTSTQQVAATGAKNTGDQATGSVVMTAKDCVPFNGSPDDIPSGTGVSTNGLTFITGKKAHFSFDHATGSCIYYQSGSVDITAQNGGAKYNVSGATFSVANNPGVAASGSASGGTDNIIKIISQGDVDGAKQKLSTQDTSAIQDSLAQTLRNEGLYPLTATFKAGTPVVTTSANVGDQADNVTVTEAVTYTIIGVKKADLDTLIKQNVGTQIDATDQVILDDGLGQATVNVTGGSDTKVQITLQTTATVGPDISVASIKRQAAGKRIGDVKTMINTLPGVTSVDVELSPFWVSAVPSNPHQVTVTIKKAH